LAPIFTGSVSARIAAENIYPITGYIVPSHPNKQTTFQIQRNMELISAIQQMLMSASASRRPSGVPQQADEVTVVVLGGSNGGNIASWMSMWWPDRVHGALASVFPPSLRREVGEHAFWDYLMTSSGFSYSGAAYQYQDALQWAQFPNQISTPGNRFTFWDLSCLLQHSAGTIPRPIYFLVGDEDTTTTGTDWVRQLTGGAWTQSGKTPSGTEFLSWSVADNRCHEQGPYTHPDPSNSNQYIGLMNVFPDTARAAIDSRAAVAGTQVINRPESSTRQLTGDDVYDPPMFDSASAGITIFNDNTQQPAQGYFQLSSDFKDELDRPGKLPGAGTWLGREDTMLIRNQHVYVGSGDGVVSKYSIDGTKTQLPLRLRAQSEMLGPGISGLTFGSFGNLGSVVVASTYGRVFALAPQTLGIVASGTVSFDAFRPRRILLADVDPGVGDGPELVCASHNGGVVVFGAQGQQIVEKLHWAEPGVIDIVERNGALSLLSGRGVVATVFLSASPNLVANRQSGSPFVISDYQGVLPTPPAYLLGASSPQSGFPLDLELDSGSHNSVVALFRDNAHTERSIRRFYTPSGAMMHAVGDIGGRAPTVNLAGDGSGRSYDIETVRGYTSPSGEEEGSDTDGYPGDRLLVLSAGTLFLFDPAFTLIGKRNLGTFAPANRAVDIAVGDLRPSLSLSGYADEVVISTQGGRLVWMNVGELLGTSNTSLSSPYTSGDRSPGAPDPHCNESTCATWGMAWGGTPQAQTVEMFDQNMTRWSAPASGAPISSATFVHELNQLAGLFADHVKGAARVDPTLLPITVTQFAAPPYTPGWGEPVGYPNQLGMLTLPSYPKIGSWLFVDGPTLPTNWMSDNTSAQFWQRFWGEYTVFFQGGDTLASAGGALEVHWWSGRQGLSLGSGGGTTFYGNLVQGFNVSQGQLGQWWASTYSSQGQPAFLDLRSSDSDLAGNDLQCLRVLEQGRVLLGTPGGDLRVVDTGLNSGSDPNVSAGTGDLGHGIPSVGIWRSGSTDHIFAVCAIDHQPSAPLMPVATPDSMVGAIHHFTRQAGSTVLNPVGNPIRLAGLQVGMNPSTDILAPVGAFVFEPSAGGNWLVVTGAFGHVAVFALTGPGLAISPQPRQLLRLRGMLGLHGSMLGSGDDLFIASSQGVWKLEVQ